MDTEDLDRRELERTLALIKPDAVQAGKADEIMQLIELAGFTIIAQQKLQLTKARAEAFYAEHYGKAFFPALVSFMTSGPIWALVLCKSNAILDWRARMGPTNTQDARSKAPKSMRALYGTDGTRNATHGSDSPASAAREVKFFFPDMEVEPIADAGAAQKYIAEKLQPTLVAALTALAKQKPATSKSEAVTFLARWMLDNNPNKPQVVQPAGVLGASGCTAACSDAGDDPVAAVEAKMLGMAVHKAGQLEPQAQDAAASFEEETQAATKVQAAFRGHQVRLAMHKTAA